MKLDELNQFLNLIDEMANMSTRDHGIPNVKISIRQPGKDRYVHDVSVKVFGKDIAESILIIIDRSSGKLRIADNTALHGINSKLIKKTIHFIEINYENIVQLWDNQSLAIDDLQWIKEN